METLSTLIHSGELVKDVSEAASLA
jgi:hypothetical protein